ncbi:FkbM family methyltransferase [Bordetella avium]|nr:FkbM family methyltransferase [Bordetella avium]RIQ35146.1 FkbM family methyltransferase [Bordetella avium]RIQ49493.1 FkbM family methyltransferase [Bordetella avium]RIQ74635.1 FkbM family methyltransferase [Bordetella avium]
MVCRGLWPSSGSRRPARAAPPGAEPMSFTARLSAAAKWPAWRARRTLWKINKRRYRPSFGPAYAPGLALRSMGTAYGGWTFVDDPQLRCAHIISCGLGTDASFDIKFATHYGASTLIVDPTPSAIRHFRAIEARLGEPAALPYPKKGNIPAEAYDLRAIRPGQLRLAPTALWVEAGNIRFYAPPDNGVSHSINNYGNHYRHDTPYIEVAAAPLDILMRDYGLSVPPLIKLDIEGAEIEVIHDMMEKGIFPQQILVEYDELARPSARNQARIQDAHHALLAHGYLLVHCDGHMNFTYWRN